ncbi:VPLPA-CTERM sorting domain-containing protein [Roseobacter denitrificans]|nr:VPLPA-CTERM sorting domain-containing protein [Roseobacter denitrificans]SFF95499.1 VPLPA-CTERM protein sorting domain-containing protein [Roseobacter denitrificans OCh 114]
MTVEATGSPGGDTIGFVNDTMRPNDTDDDATADLGNFFLRTTNALSGPLNTTPVFSLSFAGGASSVSGEIWDIDGTSVNNTEQWNVTANLLGGGSSSILSFLGSSNGSNTATSLDGKAWAFSFSGLGTITSVDFNFVGSETTGIGAAVDNLVIAPVPLPAGGLLLISGFAVAAAVRRRRKPAA